MGHSNSKDHDSIHEPQQNSTKSRSSFKGSLKHKSSKDKNRRSQPLPPSPDMSDSRQTVVTRTSSYSQPQQVQGPSSGHQRKTSSHTVEKSTPSRQFSLTKQTSSSSQGGSPTSTKHSQIEKYFTKYKDAGEDAILAEGMEKFCVDLGVEPTESIVLVLAWKFEASQMCRFTREEFMNGCQKLRAHDAKSLKERFPELSAEARNKRNFKDLYNFTFSFGLDHSTGQRSLPIDMAIPLWDLVFSQNRPKVLDRWFEFLRNNEVRGVSRDTWNMFLPFVETILPDMSNYDETEAWPSLFDDFVEAELEKL